jgi:hypothetical protein
MAAEEIMHFRDWKLSLRHRLYGPDFPMFDLDFVVMESFDHTCRALVEYKHCHSDWDSLAQRPIAKVLTSLGDAAGIPAWIAVYDPRTWNYKVLPLNDRAREVIQKKYHTEVEYVSVLYRVKGMEAPAEVLAKLNATNRDIDPEEQEAWIREVQGPAT